VKVTTEALERCELLVTIEVEPKKEQEMLKKAASRIGREVNIPGFRRGKAPFNVIVRRFGREAVQQEALEQSIDKLVRNALESEEIDPYAQIQLEDVAWEPLTIKIKVPTEPVVELSDYREIRMEPEAVEVTAEDVGESLKNLQEQTATWAPVDRPAQIGDLVSMAVVEKDGDELLAEHESVEHELDPPEEHEGHNHPDLTTPLLGLSAGDEKTFSLTYPEDYNDQRYAGKDITFEVEILGIKEKEVEPLDDDFAKSVSDFETLDELKADIEENIKGQRERQRDSDLGNKVLEKIIEETKIEWPAAFEEERVEDEIERYEPQMKNYGLTIDNYLQVQNKTKEEFTEEIRGEVVERLKRSLVLSKIAEREKLDVSDSEILSQAKLLADMSGRGDQLWRDILASNTQQSIIGNDLLVDKTVQWLAAIAKGEDPQVEEIEEETEATAAEDAETEASAVEVEESATTEVPDPDEDKPDEEPSEEPAPAKAQ